MGFRFGDLEEGVLYSFLSWAELAQYKIADTIGIQAPGNALFFKEYSKEIQSKVEVLWTWTSELAPVKCSIDISSTKLAGKKIFLYAGNMGAAQNMWSIMGVVKLYQSRSDIGFLMVGRGDQMESLKKFATRENLENMLFYDEVDSAEIPSLCRQCSVGIVALDLRHKTHNIPGKFLTYMQSGLPVLAKVNAENDLIKLISEYDVGYSVSSEDPIQIGSAVENLLFKLSSSVDISANCRKLADELFSSDRAAMQITRALQLKNM